MWFEDWYSIARTLIVGSLTYAGLIVVLRVSGKRTLSKMNAFDLVITVALGSTLATVLLSRRVPLVTGLTALALLAALQFVITWASVRSSSISRLIKSEPRLLFHNGSFLPGAMKKERVTRAEIRQAMRNSGILSADQVFAVVLETDGSINVLRHEADSHSSLADVV